MNLQNLNPLASEDEAALYRAIRSLPHYCEYECDECGSTVRVSSLQIYAKCDKCGWEFKQRSFAGGPDLQDLLLIVLQWFAEGGMQVPDELQNLVDNDWEEWEEWFSEDA